MAEISLSLNNIQKIRTVNIKEYGVVRVRRLGAGEELDLSSKHRRLYKLIDELNKTDLTKFDLSKPEDLKKLEKENKKLDDISNEIAGIKAFEFQTYKRCFSDDKGGAVVDKIMSILTDDERGALFNQIFEEPKDINLDEPVKPEEEKQSDGGENA